jgi:uncharacterized membrane protein
MSGHQILVALHLLAVGLWIGHMLVWSIVAGPALKRVEPPATAELLRDRMVYLGGLGWPALAVLVPTGLYLLWLRGVGPGDLLTLAFLDRPDGAAIAIKLALVVWMIAYQSIWGHRPAPLANWVNIAAALVVLACSVVIVRGWS